MVVKLPEVEQYQRPLPHPWGADEVNQGALFLLCLPVELIGLL